MRLALREALLGLPARAAAQRAEHHDDRVLAVRVRAVRARRAQHPRGAGTGRGARGDPRLHRRGHARRGTGRRAMGDIGAFPEVARADVRHAGAGAGARARGAGRVRRRVRGGVPAGVDRRAAQARAPAIPTTVSAVAARIRTLPVRRRRALRRGVGREALPPAQHRDGRRARRSGSRSRRSR